MSGSLKLPHGVRSRYNASTYESDTVWKDAYGNHDAENSFIEGHERARWGQAWVDVFQGGYSEVKRKNKYEENQNPEQEGKITRSKGFAYVKGDEFSKWKLTGKLTKGEWTIAYVTRYDPTDFGPCRATQSDGPCRNRILVYGNSAFGHDFNKVGYSNHDSDSKGYGEVGGDSYGDVKGLPGDNAQWLFAIEQPKRSIVRGEFSNDWFERKDGMADDLNDVEFHINTTTQVSRWNVADIIYWPRILTDGEIKLVRDYLDVYRDGGIDVFNDNTILTEAGGGGDGGGGGNGGDGDGGDDDDNDDYDIHILKIALLVTGVLMIALAIYKKYSKKQKPSHPPMGHPMGHLYPRYPPPYAYPQYPYP